jgi:hypothetical protein
MNLEDYESDNTDSDDCEFNPLDVDDSGEESIDEQYEGKEYEDQGEEPENKSSKRKKRNKGRSTRATASPPKEVVKDVIATDPEAEKKRIDALFADFLSGTDPVPAPKPSSTSTSSQATTTTTASKKVDIPKEQPRAKSPPRIFEFAGETIEISNSQNEQSSANAPSSKSSNPKAAAALKRPAGGSGLSSMLNQLGKKNKLSVLEKTKLDWDGFKSKEGINEELKTHNRGREG